MEGRHSYDGRADQSTPDFMGTTKVSHYKLYRIWPDFFRLDTWDDSVLTSSLYNVKKKSLFAMAGGQPITLSPGPYDESFEFMPVTIAPRND